jgi:hypothetical protein
LGGTQLTRCFCTAWVLEDAAAAKGEKPYAITKALRTDGHTLQSTRLGNNDLRPMAGAAAVRDTSECAPTIYAIASEADVRLQCDI